MFDTKTSFITVLIAAALLKFAASINDLSAEFGTDDVTITPRPVSDLVNDAAPYVQSLGIRGSIGCR